MSAIFVYKSIRIFKIFISQAMELRISLESYKSCKNLYHSFYLKCKMYKRATNKISTKFSQFSVSIRNILFINLYMEIVKFT